MMKTMKKGILRTVAFVVAWTLCWTTISNSLFTSVSYAAEAEEAAPVEEIIEEIPEETAEEAPAEEAPAEEAVVEETPAEEAEPQNLPLEGEVAAQPTEEVSSEQTLDQVPAQPTDEQTPAEPTVTEESISLTITYKTSEGGSVSVEKEVIEYKKITTTDAEGNATVTTDPETITVKGAKATADEGYEFTAWKSGDKVVSEKATFVPALPRKDVTFTAVFTEKKVGEESSEEETTPHQSATPTASPQGEAQEQVVNSQNLPLEGAQDPGDPGSAPTGAERRQVPAKQADEVEDDTEEEDEVSYPAASFTGETGDVSVRAHVKEGVFPEGTTMNVSAVSASEAIAAAQDMVGEGTEVVDAVAADITFRYEGEEIQPEGGVYVRLSTKRAIAGESHEAITIDGSGSASSMGGASAHSASFDTDHFTVYGVVGTSYEDEDVEAYIRHKYLYYSGDPSTSEDEWPAVAEQIYRNGDTIAVPADPKGDSKHTFTGWVIKSFDGTALAESEWKKITNGDQVKIDPATMSAEESAEADSEPIEVKVYATYDSLFQVTFYTKDVENVEDLETATVYVTYVKTRDDSVTLPGEDEMEASGIFNDGEGFAGWKLAGTDTIYDGGSIYKVEEDTQFVPVIKGIHTVTFAADPLGFLPEGLVEEPKEQKVVDSEQATEPAGLNAGSEHDGYVLKAWYSEAPNPETKKYNESAKWDFGTPVTKDITLYAEWEKKEVSYRVIVMQEIQNPSDAKTAANYVPWSQISELELKGLPGDPVDIDKAIGYADIDHRTVDDNGGGGYASTWHYHLSGTGVRNGANEYYAATVEQNGSDVAHYSANGGWDDSGTAVIAGDGSTIVRVYMCRNTYTLKVRFAYGSSNKTNTENGWGAAFGPYVREDYKQYLPDENPAYGDLSGVDFEIRFRENLYSNVYLKDDKVARLMGGSWEFLRYYGYGTGKTVFDFTNTGYNLLAKKEVRDGGTIYLGVSYVSGKYEHPFVFVRYNPDGTVRGKKTERSVSYSDRHSHRYTIGSVDEGFRLVKIETGTVTYTTPEGARGYSFEYEDGDISRAMPMVLTYEPIEYKITFEPNDGETPSFAAKNTAWPTYTNNEAFFVGDVFGDVVINDPNGAGAARYQAGHQEVINGVLKEFRGWYTNAKGEGKAYTFAGQIMPDENLTFYGKWVPMECKVVYHKNYETDPEVYAERSVIIGNTAERVANPERTGYVFNGWYYKQGDTEKLFSFGEKLTKDKIDELKSNGSVEDGTAEIHLYAKWTLPGPYSIRYDADDGTLSAKLAGQLANVAEGKTNGTDKRKYYGGAKAPVLGVAEKEGEVFIGWKVDKTGDILKDGDTFKADDSMVSEWDQDASGNQLHTGTIVLVAQYDKNTKLEQATYHTNFPDGVTAENDEKTIDTNKIVNDTFTVENPSSIGFPTTCIAADGSRYRFAGWTTNENAPKLVFDLDNASEYFKPGNAAAAGQGENRLYAVWEVIQGDPTPDEPEPEPEPEPTPNPEPTPEDPTDIPDEPTPTTDTPDDPAPEIVTPAPEPVNPVVTFIENILGVRRVPEEAAAADDDTPAVAGSRRSRVDTNDYSRMEYWMILALGCILIQADLLRKVKKQKATN